MPKKLLADFRSGKLELLKQNAVYVGLPRKGRKNDLKGKVIIPFTVGMPKSRRQITVVNDFLMDLTLGTIKEVYSIDTEEVESMLNEHLLAELIERWKFRGRKATASIKAVAVSRLNVLALTFDVLTRFRDALAKRDRPLTDYLTFREV